MVRRKRAFGKMPAEKACRVRDMWPHWGNCGQHGRQKARRVRRYGLAGAADGRALAKKLVGFATCGPAEAVAGSTRGKRRLGFGDMGSLARHTQKG